MLEPTQDIFAHVLLRPTVPDAPGLCLLTWRTTAEEFAGRATQVYVDGVLHDVVTDPRQREMWLHLDRLTPTRVELLAVDESRMWRDHADALDAWSPGFTTTASVAIERDESWPFDSRVVVTVDGEDEPSRPLWSPRDARGGFGGMFGDGGFGWDMSTSVGHGVGLFGRGRFGAGGTAWRWSHDALPDGEHEIDLRIETADGATIATLDTPVQVGIEHPPAPPTNVGIDDSFTLTWA